MTRTYLTYSKDLGDFSHDLISLSKNGLYGLRLINKGKSIDEFISRINEILSYSDINQLKLDLLIDLPGEKPLIGNVGSGLKINANESYLLCNAKKELAKNEIPTLNFINRIDRSPISEGDIVSIADGELEMNIIRMGDDVVTCVAKNSFLLSSNRSFSIKGNKLPVQPVSANDQALIDQLKITNLSKRVKILVSFVTRSAHVTDVKATSADFHVVSKIENVIADDDLEEIIRVSHSVMLGRGDLISTSKMNEVFDFQKKVIKKCQALDKELIVATGLFGDLKNSAKPSISDLMDFGFLRSEGVDAFLIGGSNASQYPFETLNLITNFEDL